ncbi:hypothetical protein GEMRC1_007259 [Eukaryota sp. GEM-RC1]
MDIDSLLIEANCCTAELQECTSFFPSLDPLSIAGKENKTFDSVSTQHSKLSNFLCELCKLTNEKSALRCLSNPDYISSVDSVDVSQSKISSHVSNLKEAIRSLNVVRSELITVVDSCLHTYNLCEDNSIEIKSVSNQIESAVNQLENARSRNQHLQDIQSNNEEILGEQSAINELKTKLSTRHSLPTNLLEYLNVSQDLLSRFVSLDQSLRISDDTVQLQIGDHSVTFVIDDTYRIQSSSIQDVKISEAILGHHVEIGVIFALRLYS